MTAPSFTAFELKLLQDAFFHSAAIGLSNLVPRFIWIRTNYFPDLQQSATSKRRQLNFHLGSSYLPYSITYWQQEISAGFRYMTCWDGNSFDRTWQSTYIVERWSGCARSCNCYHHWRPLRSFHQWEQHLFCYANLRLFARTVTSSTW